MKYIFVLLFSVMSFGQQLEKVDFINAFAKIKIDSNEKEIAGKMSYEFKVNQLIDTIKIDAISMNFTNLSLNNKMVKYKVTKKQLLLFEGFKKGKNILKFDYDCKPRQTMYFTGLGSRQQVWTQGQGKYTSHWLPSFDDVNEKVIFSISLEVDHKFKAISNGLLHSKITLQPLSTNKVVWNYSMQKPMSSYLVMIAIGDFLYKTETSQSGISLENYYQPIDEDKYPFTYKDSKNIFDFLEKEIGVKYPWKVYRQIPVEDFLYAGMENTTSTIFSQDYVVDESAYNDRNYLNVNAHELAHQWFGDLVTAKSSKHHWLQEGFATYYALLAERKIFGDDYFYNQLFSYANRIKIAAKTDTIPVMNEKASSLSFYQKGAWALHYIRESIGEKKFRKAVKCYLKKYQYKTAETDDFLAEINKVSNFDTNYFKKKWLEDYQYPANDINFLLTKNAFMRDLLKLQYQRKIKLADKYNLLKVILTNESYAALKVEAIYQITNEPFENVAELFELAINSNDISVRRFVAQSISNVPESFKSQFETLLVDLSYETKQAAFIALWKSFPNNQSKYLEIAKKWEDNNKKELRILYLISTILYSENHQNDLNATIAQQSLNELILYTSPNYESSIRQNAFESLLDNLLVSKEVVKNLVNATRHHKWQFSKFAKDKIKFLSNNPKNYQLFESIIPELNSEEQQQLKKMLDK